MLDFLCVFSEEKALTLIFWFCAWMMWTKYEPPVLRTLTRPTVYMIIGAAFLVLIMGKVGRSYRYYPVADYASLYQQIKEKSHTLPHSQWSVCLRNIKAPVYATVLPLTYKLMPHRVYVMQEVSCDIVVEGGKNSQKRL